MVPELTRDYLEDWWLDTRGGRDRKDVIRDKRGEYVVMSNTKVYLPPLSQLYELHKKRPQDTLRMF